MGQRHRTLRPAHILALAQQKPGGHVGGHAEGHVVPGYVQAGSVTQVLLHHLGVAQVPAVDVRAVLEAVKARLVLLDLVLQEARVGHVAHAPVQLDPPQPLLDGGDLKLAVADCRLFKLSEDSSPLRNLLLDGEVSFVVRVEVANGGRLRGRPPLIEHAVVQPSGFCVKVGFQENSLFLSWR